MTGEPRTGPREPVKELARSTPSAPDPSDQVRKTEAAISAILRIGVALSIVVIAAGLVLSFVRHPEYRTSSTVRQTIIQGHFVFPHSFGTLVSGLGSGQGGSLVALGLLLLLLTPIARVAVSIVAFVYQRDRTYVVLGAYVLVVLVTSFLLGKAGG
jgi:uncharacterized membrane protein